MQRSINELLTALALIVGVGVSTSAVAEGPPAQPEPSTGSTNDTSNGDEEGDRTEAEGEGGELKVGEVEGREAEISALKEQAPNGESPLPEESPSNTLWFDLHELHDCDAAEVLCLRGDGGPLFADAEAKTHDALPKNLAQGTSITVKTIGCAARFADVKFEIGLESSGSGDQLFRVDYTAGGAALVAAGKRGDVEPGCGEDPKHYPVLNSTTVTVPSKPARISITFKRQATKQLPELTASYSAKVLRGLYFLDISFAAPFVIGGERKITAVRDPNLDLRRLEIEQDLLIKPAVMLNLFPGGRRLGALTSFGRDRDCSGMSIRCRRRNIGRVFANSLGLQFGLSLDTESFGEQFYLGAMFEPVVGLNLGFGLALIQGEYYRDGFTDGQLVGADVAANEWGHEKMMARPYFSVSFSLDIFRNVRAAMTSQEITSLGNGGG